MARLPTPSIASAAVADSYKFDDLYSHDFMLTLRWNCCDFDAPPPRYVYTPPPPVYTPPPVYQPLQSRS